MKLSLAGNDFEMLLQRAVWWPARRTAVVADVHLGKDQVFRRSGIAIPGSVLDKELAALDALVEHTRCERLLVLGDWVHAAPLGGESWPSAIANWRARHEQLAVDLVLGNHDRNLTPWLNEWRIGAYIEPMEINGLKMFHEVDMKAPAAGMSGHLHPVVWLRSGRERLRLPAFARRGDHLILPAFGRFTGGFDGLAKEAWTLYPVAGERVVDIPSSRMRTL
ncbi:MAG TPA: ligase-associated DNA damage response endonuclease PdeM [Wenzhouxiangellaceae bacterium]|nr:ligase-associated DNA damage response endonuclease PdeM [Wenzhouxiangellaceae bacterium]